MSDKKYTGLFLGILILQASAWVLIPYLTLSNPPLDVLEGVTWSQNMAWGYTKGPPLFAWLLGLGTYLMPGSLLPPLILSQVSIAIAYWAIWRLAKYLLGPRDAIVTVCLTSLVYYFNYPSPEFNPIILQLSFSAVAGSYFYTALIENRLRDWLIVGVAVGLGLLSRYSILLHLLPMAIFALLHRETRDFILRRGFLLGALVGLAIISPHVYWVFDNDFSPLHYIDRRAGSTEGMERITQPLRFLGAQFAAIAVAAIALGLAVLPFGRNYDPMVNLLRHGKLSRNYLLATGLAPALIVVLTAILIGRGPRAMWGAPLWVFTPLMAIAMLRDLAMPLYRRRLIMIWAAAFTLPAIIFAFSMTFWPNIDSLKGRNKRTHFPGFDLAATVTDRWREATGLPLTYVMGEMWLAGSTGYYSSDHPWVIQNGRIQDAPWIDVDHVRHCGAVTLFHAQSDRESYVSLFEQLGIHYEEQQPLKLPKPRFARPSPAFTVGWGIAWPSEGAATYSACGRRRKGLI